MTEEIKAKRDELAEKYAKPYCATSCSNHSLFSYRDGFDAGFTLGLQQADKKIMDLEIRLADRSEKYGLFMESGLDQKCRELKKLKEASEGLLKALENISSGTGQSSWTDQGLARLAIAEFKEKVGE